MKWLDKFRRELVIAHDLLWVPLALGLAFWLRFNFREIPPEAVSALWRLLFIALPVQAGFFWFFGLYRGIWRFASIPDLIRIIKGVLVGVAVTLAIHVLLFRLEGLPRSVVVLYPLLLGLGLTIPRLFYRWYREHRLLPDEGASRTVLVLGAGRAGEQLVRDMLRSGEYRPLGFLDDDPEKHGREIHGVRVLGSVETLEEEVANLRPGAVVVAIPSADSAFMRDIHERCRRLDVSCLTLPPLSELSGREVGAGGLREISLEDLLGREEVELDIQGIDALLRGRRVLVTGAGGSIGGELCRQILRHDPEMLILLDHGEYNLYAIEKELRPFCPGGTMLKAVLGDVRDSMRMAQVFAQQDIDVVFHAAAYKHVPLVERNPVEGIRTNVFGTRVVADLCVQHEVGHFVMISTDKAVNPTSVMGASKRLAEIYCQALQGRGRTRFITTRFGNVLGSTGSVVPLFREQIERGGPVTVTHPEVKRYFMTIPEAVSLVLQAASMGQGGEIFVLDMGEPVKIVDLARQMIQLSGLRPDHDIRIEFIGLRPGEKLFEELFHDGESLLGTAHTKILLAQAREFPLEEVRRVLDELAGLCGSLDMDTLHVLLRRLVPEYRPQITHDVESAGDIPDRMH